MSNNWIRGSRCGVDNCRTHYYKIIDGQRVCQFGHVFEGHIEYNDDPDGENLVVTRRLKIPGQTGLSQQSQITPSLRQDESRRRLYGAAGRELFFRCYQSVLRSQTKTLIKLHKLPENFEVVVKDIWLEYLTKVLTENIKKIDDEEDEDIDGQDDYTTSTDIHNSQHNYTFRKIPMFIDSLAILYLACRYLQIPIYLSNFVSWATTSEIPYMRASYEVPKTLRLKLPLILLAIFEPKRLPVRGELCAAISKLATKLKYNNLTFNYEPLLLSLNIELILPPRVYIGVRNMIDHYKTDFEIPIYNFKNSQSSNSSAVRDFPEIKLITMVIIVTKLYFLNYRNQRPIPSLKKWLEIVRKLNLDGKTNRSFNNLLGTLSTSGKSELEVLDWDDEKTTKYLDWFEKTIVSTDKNSIESEQPIALRRLFRIFDLKREDGEKEKEQQTKEEAKSTEIRNIESGFEELLAMDEDDVPVIVREEELREIERTFVESLTLKFGITEPQLKRNVELMETLILDGDTKLNLNTEVKKKRADTKQTSTPAPKRRQL